MIRMMKWSIFVGLAAVALAGGACAADEDDGLKSLVADCGSADVKLADIDSCLERARVLGETDPSPQIQSLTARLERIAERGDDDNDLSKAYTLGRQSEPSAGGTTTAPSAATAAPHGNMH